MNLRSIHKACLLFLLLVSALIPAKMGLGQTYTYVRSYVSPINVDQPSYPTGLLVHSDGSLYISNGWWADPQSNHIDSFDKNGSFIASFGAHENLNGQLNQPQFMAENSSKNLLVVNTQSSRIQEFTTSGVFIREWGSYGSEQSQFIYPCGILVLPANINSTNQECVYVVDYLNHRVQVFDVNGAFLFSFGTNGLSDGQLSSPIGIAMSTTGTLYITDFSGRISEFDVNGNFLRVFARFSSGTRILGISDVRTSDNKNLLPVVNYSSKEVMLLDSTGNVVEKISHPTGFWQEPWNVIVSGNRLFVSDRTEGKVHEYVSSYPPTSSFSADPSTVWSTIDVTGTITATDNAGGSGVKEIHYSINLGTDQIVTGSTATFNLTDNGTTSISYFAVDNAGNTETSKLATVQVDKIAPITTLSRNAGLVSLSATDAHSGVSKIKYQVDNGAIQNYSGPIPTIASSITYYSEDVAGNNEQQHVYIVAPAIRSLALSQLRVPGGIGVVGTVTLDKAAGVGGTVVTLSSSLPRVAVVDTTISIPEGATTVSFDIDANAVAMDTVVSVTATCDDTTQSVFLTVTAPTPVQVSWTTSPVVGGTSTTGTLIISGPAPTGGTTVSLASTSLSALVASSVTIPAGAMTTTFTVSTNVVSNDTSAVISTTVYGAKLKSTLGILGPKVSSVTLASTSIASTTTTTGTVTLSTNAPVGGKVVTLSSSNSAVASVPISVTVTAGTRTATFTITAGTVNANTNATITATTNNSSGSATITVTPLAAVLSTLTTVVTGVTGGVPVTGTVTLTSAAPTGGAVVTLASSSTTIGTVPASVTVAAGSTTATFTITARTVTVASALTITATRNGVSKTATITVNPVRVVSTLTLNPTSVRGGTNSTGTVTLTGIATEAVVVTLTSGTTAVARVSASVTVPAGSTTATFTITTLTQTATRTSIITARTGTTSRTATLSVTR